MEAILQKLSVADNKVIQEGTRELKEAFKNPDAIPALCDVLVTSQNAQVRQTAAVVLRRRLGKKHQWNKLTVDIRTRIKAGMLQALVNEQEKLVKNSIAQFIGVLGKYEFPNNTWPEILQFIHELCSSDNLLNKELGMYTLSIMTEISKSSYLVHAEAFGQLFSTMLSSTNDPGSNLAYYTVLTMHHLVPIISGNQNMINLYHSLLPSILQVIKSFSSEDEKRACELFEILEDLIEYAVNVIVPHVVPVMEVCLFVGSNKDFPTAVQIKAIGVVGFLIRTKSKVVQKAKLIEPIIDVLMTLMAQVPEDDVNEEYFLGDPDQFTATTIATQTLDLIAINVPPTKVVPYLLTRIEPALQGNDIYAQKAAFLALAVLAEGCADHIRSKYLEAFLKCIYDGIRNANIVVRNAAFFALGQFAEHLQPEISQFASDLLPVFFECLSQIYLEMEKSRNEPAGLDRMFYALQSFCVNLDDGLIPYLPTLMERLFQALEPTNWSLQLKRVGLSTLEAVTAAAKENMLPYYEKVVTILNFYISQNSESDVFELQPYAIECLATLAENIAPEVFKPLAPQTLQMAMKILEESDDPDVKKSIFALLASLSSVLKQEIEPALPKIIEEMISSIQSSEGIVAHYDEEDKDGIDIYDDLSESEGEGEEDIDCESSSSDSTQCRFSVENSYNDEKEQACLSITEICKHLGVSFLPYLEKSFEEIFKLINYPQEDIRCVAIMALEQFCITLSEVPDGKQALYKALEMFIPKCAEIIRADEEQNIVNQAVNAYGHLLEELKGHMFVGEGHREAIMNCVIDLLTEKTVCQDTDIGASGDAGEDEAESEQTELLLECAGDVIPKFGGAMTPEEFNLYFANVLQLLSVRAKKKNSVSQRSFAYGTIAECMKPLGMFIQNYATQLLMFWHSGVKDADPEVRNNALYGLGEMVLHGKDCLFSQYNQILETLLGMLPKETHSGARDNISGAIAKMIIVNTAAIPLEQVLPLFLQYLPLTFDFSENESVVKCLYGLYQQGNPVLKNNLREVIRVITHIYHKKESNSDDVTNMVVEFIRSINRDFPEEFSSIVSGFGPEVMDNVRNLFV